jgi:hypothetical protein
VSVRPVLDRVSCFADLLLEDKEEAFAGLRRAESTGRPVGTAEFVSGLERLLGRSIARRAPRPAPAVKDDARQMRLLDSAQSLCGERHMGGDGYGSPTFPLTTELCLVSVEK